jgi:hypothetical protein
MTQTIVPVTLLGATDHSQSRNDAHLRPLELYQGSCTAEPIHDQRILFPAHAAPHVADELVPTYSSLDASEKGDRYQGAAESGQNH